MPVKIVTQLVLPPAGPLLVILLGLLLWMFRRRRAGVAFVFLGFVSLWALATPVVSDLLTRTLEDDAAATTVEATSEADAIVVLGGGLGPAASPREHADLNGAADRLLHAARLFRAGKAPLVVVSGGYPAWMGDVPPEARSAADLLVEWGVPESAIVLESKSLTTRENAVETATILAGRGIRRVLLVTSARHMPRALATFKTAGVAATAAPTDYRAVGRGETTALDWIPASEALDESRRALHEWLGYLYYKIRGWV